MLSLTVVHVIIHLFIYLLLCLFIQTEAAKDSLTHKLKCIDAVTHSSICLFIHLFIMFIHADGGGERLINPSTKLY